MTHHPESDDWIAPEGWQPIETAPKRWFDAIDLWWGANECSAGQRIPDCNWDNDPEEGEPGWFSKDYGRIEGPSHWMLTPPAPGGSRPRSWDEFWNRREGWL